MVPAVLPPDGDDDTSVQLRRARNGDAESLAWVVRHFSPLLSAQAGYRLRGALRRHCDPEDLVQDVWAAVLPKLCTLGPWDRGAARAFLSYLSTTLLRRVRDLLERHVRGKPAPAEPASATDPLAGVPAAVTGVLTAAQRHETAARITDAIASLSPREQELLIKRGIEQQPLAAVAEQLGMQPNSAAVAYRRALQRLQERLPATLLAALAADDG